MVVLPWFDRCYNTLTPARTQRLHLNDVMRCIVTWGISSTMISSLANSMHPPEIEIRPLKTAYGSICGRIINFFFLVLSPYEMHLSTCNCI